MNKETMLVVEDEDIMREALSDYFSDIGHKVDTASDGDLSLEKFDLKNYNVLIVDLKLPGRDGISVLNEIKAKNPEAKVIIITAYPTVETETEAMNSGALNYLPKPFELDYLETIIEQSYEIDIVRVCTLGYQCQRVCDFHASLMKKEKFSSDPRIQPYLEKLYSQSGRYQCRYTMSGEMSVRSCSQLYSCESCELHQTIQDEVDRQHAIKAENKKKMQEKHLKQMPVIDKSERKDH